MSEDGSKAVSLPPPTSASSKDGKEQKRNNGGMKANKGMIMPILNTVLRYQMSKSSPSEDF